MQHKYAAQVAAHARALERHVRKVQRLHAHAEATAIAGADFAEYHTLWFSEYESRARLPRAVPRRRAPPKAVATWAVSARPLGRCCWGVLRRSWMGHMMILGAVGCHWGRVG